MNAQIKIILVLIVFGMLAQSQGYIKYQEQKIHNKDEKIQNLEDNIKDKEAQIKNQQSIIEGIGIANKEKDKIQRNLQDKINQKTKEYNDLKKKFETLAASFPGNSKDINEALIKNKELMQEFINKESKEFIKCLRDLDLCELIQEGVL